MKVNRPDIAPAILQLSREGMSTTGIIIALRLYHDAEVSYGQVRYYLEKAGQKRPRIDKGRVIREQVAA
jgi:hypothetical protein